MNHSADMPPPALLPPNATAAMVQAWYLDYHNQSTAFHAANPIGPILTHEPSDETKRGWLMHALEQSRHTRVRNIYLKYIQPDHQARPYGEVRSDIDNIIEVWDRSGSSSHPEQGSRSGREYSTPYKQQDTSNRYYRRRESPEEPDRDNNTSNILLATKAAPRPNSATTAPPQCRNCTKQHATRDCDSLVCSACQGTFQSITARREHYHRDHRRQTQSVSFDKRHRSPSTSRTCNPRHTSNTYYQRHNSSRHRNDQSSDYPASDTDA